MSNSFAGIATTSYRGTPFRLPVTLPQYKLPASNILPPSVVSINIDWNVYWQLQGNPVNSGVSINLLGQSTAGFLLDRIVSVKIDNTGSPTPVYVQFLDTGDVINCPADCSVTYPVLTGQLQCNIFAIGLQRGFIPTTRVFLYNVLLPPSTDYEVSQSVNLQKASPSITRGNTILNQNYSAPALGDQIQNCNILLTNSATPGLWGTPYSSGFVYLQMFYATAFSLTAGETVNVSIESTGAAGQLFEIQGLALVPIAGEKSATTILCALYGMNLKLDATQTWQARNVNTLTSGTLFSYMSYTVSQF